MITISNCSPPPRLTSSQTAEAIFYKLYGVTKGTAEFRRCLRENVPDVFYFTEDSKNVYVTFEKRHFTYSREELEKIYWIAQKIEKF